MPAVWRLDTDDGQETVEVSWLAPRTGYGRSVFNLACAQLSPVSLESVIRLQSPRPIASWGRICFWLAVCTMLLLCSWLADWLAAMSAWLDDKAARPDRLISRSATVRLASHLGVPRPLL